MAQTCCTFWRPMRPGPRSATKLHSTLDWDRRLLHMRMHTALHVMSAVIKGNVTGGQVGADKSRLTSISKARFRPRNGSPRRSTS